LSFEGTGTYVQTSSEPQGGDEAVEFVGDAFELGSDTRASFGVREVNHGGPADGVEVLEEPLHAVWVGGGLSGAQVKEASEEIAEHAGEDVDVELLIGPVVLGPQGDVDGVLEMGEDGLDGALPSVGADDLGGWSKV
jgi:hypothetical protein